MKNKKILKVRQQLKNEALNEIRKIYNSKYNFPYSQTDIYEDFDDLPSCAEEREKRISGIIDKLERDLSDLKVII